jgi:hypothetical protein
MSADVRTVLPKDTPLMLWAIISAMDRARSTKLQEKHAHGTGLDDARPRTGGRPSVEAKKISLGEHIALSTVVIVVD